MNGDGLSHSGIIRLSDGFHARYPMKDYLDLLDLAAFQIHDNLLGKRSKGRTKRDIIIGNDIVM